MNETMTCEIAKTKAYEAMAIQDYSSAIEHFETALDLHPFNDNVQEGRADFEILLSNHTACVNSWMFSQ